ncbi:hypothetical protein DFH08DRAFT_1023643 [Mycena albidolilacea]|uniref:Splicing factor 3B subunit 1 n=1 Tax=Mycena albidolilacea TaxID=1033008 RepID=A0AAD7EJ48_9AGAR|nr:hypothetical protein DFH08DRAFT_1023643 [Mycena albidolilacea]
MALDRRNYRQVVETTVEHAEKAGVAEIVGRVVNELKDEAEPHRKMVRETITKVVEKLGASDILEWLEVRLVDGIIYSFQVQTREDQVPKLAIVIKQCGEDQLLSKLGLVLFEQRGEEYSDTLGGVVAAGGAVAGVLVWLEWTFRWGIFLTVAQKPRITPILRNSNEKVQETSIKLIGRIADRGAEFVPAREWMRIFFELLDLLKAHKKGIRRAAVNSFGYIAKSLGSQDVLLVLLTNLRVQERQSHVYSTIAIAIVAEICVIALIPSHGIRYTALGLLVAAATLCKIHLQSPSRQLSQLAVSLNHAEKYIREAMVEAPRNYPRLTDQMRRLCE